MNTSIILCLAAALSLSSIAVAILPNGECSADNQSCELESNNVIGIINGVASVDECLDQGPNSIGLSFNMINILRSWLPDGTICAPTPATLAQSKERKGSNFAA